MLDGALISRPLVFQRNAGRYVGGVSYQVVRAPPDEVVAALQSVEQLPQALPRTKRARLLEVAGSRARVELTQGNALFDATYTVHLVRRPGADELKFWLDRTRPHDIADVWGFFRVEPLGRGRSLVTVAVALDIGSGIVQSLFEERIQRVILETPRHIRDYVEPRVLAAR